MDGRSRVALNLRRLRVERGVSQETLANDAGLAIPYVSGIERATRNPSIDIMDKLAAALGVDVAELVVPVVEGPIPSEGLRAGRKAH